MARRNISKFQNGRKRDLTDKDMSISHSGVFLKTTEALLYHETRGFVVPRNKCAVSQNSMKSPASIVEDFGDSASLSDRILYFGRGLNRF